MRSLLLLPVLLATACGEVIRLRAGEALDGASVTVSGEADLSQATALRHYGLDALLRQATVEGAGPYGGRGLDDQALGSPEAQAALASALAGLATVDPARLSDPDERLAYWLDAYNAWVLLGVSARVAEDPDYTVDADGFLIFSTPYIQVSNYLLSPDDLEQGVLRGDAEFAFSDPALAEVAAAWRRDLWGDGPVDARIHVGLNCASASCPDLPPGAFQGPRVWEQLDLLATAFVNNPDKGAGPDGVSALFGWYEADFVQSFGSVSAFVEAYRTAPDAVDLSRALPYDWSRNAASQPSGQQPTCSQPW